MSYSSALTAPTASMTADDLAAETFLARYAPKTRETYTYAIKKFFGWCAQNGIRPLQIKRPILELFIRWMEEQGTSRATIGHQFGIIRSYFEYAEIDEFIEKSPAKHVKVPRVWEDPSRLISLDRFEMGLMIRTAKEHNSTECALLMLMGLMGLRVSEACSIRVEDTQHYERGHRVLKFVGKGSKPATLPIPVLVGRVVDAVIGDRTEGTLLLRQSGGQKGEPYVRHAVQPVIDRIAKKAGITKHVSAHMFRHAFVGAALETGASLRDVQLAARHADPRTTADYDNRINQLDRSPMNAVAGSFSWAA